MIVGNNQGFISTSGIMAAHTTTFRRAMDSMLMDAWDITLDLQPQRSPCPYGCTFNPTYKRYMGINGVICPGCKGEGFVVEPRQTVYKCHRRWTNEPLDQGENGGKGTPAGRMFGNFVRIKTVVAAREHIKESISATIDGVKVKLYREERPTGWAGTNLYLVTWWERINKAD